MKGRHVVILVFVFGLSLMAILFRVLPTAKPAPLPAAPPAPSAPKPPPPAPPLSLPEASGMIEVTVRSKGAPIPGAAISVHSFKDERNYQQTSDAEGKCLIQVEPGAWRIVARQGAVVASGQATVELRQTAKVELELAAGVRVEGTVRDSAGAPVAGAKITMSLTDPAFTARTDASGRYSIQDVPTGKHSVTASSDRLRPQTYSDLELTTSGQVHIRDFELKFGASLAGKVVDETGAPVPRALVTITNEVARVVRSDENGDFRADGLGEGVLTVSVAARGYAPMSESNIAPGRTDPLVLTLPRGAVVTGRVDPAPGTSFTVTLSRYDEISQKTVVVRSLPFPAEANGVFQVRDLPRGRYEITVETVDRRSPAPQVVSVEAGQTLDAGPFILAGK